MGAGVRQKQMRRGETGGGFREDRGRRARGGGTWQVVTLQSTCRRPEDAPSESNKNKSLFDVTGFHAYGTADCTTSDDEIAVFSEKRKQ